MRKTYLFLTTLFLSANFSFASDVITSKQELPSTIISFLDQYFPNTELLTCKLDRDGNEIKEFDLVLKNGDELSFNRDGRWIDVEMALDKQIPEGVVPETINIFVKNRHRGEKICEIEKEHSGYEVKLTNGCELNFTQTGEYLGMND